MRNILTRISSTRLIALSFLMMIFGGAFLLCLPISSRSHTFTPFVDALFTATSATCVTGLIVHDTFTFWSPFGQIIILILIQIGGLGLMTMISLFAIFMKKKIGLTERMLLVQSSGNIRVSGIVRLIKRIGIGTAIIESVGAILLAFRFCPQFGFLKGIYYSIFHSVSAFCNAGFDLMGTNEPCSSLTAYVDDIYINIVIMLLIVIGGIGFTVWEDFSKYHLHLRSYSLHSKIVLSTTAVLILGGAILFFILEPGYNPLTALFLSVTTRTAGFNTTNLAKLTDSGSVIAMILMFIGGSPGSTAGGIKTTTIAVIALSLVSLARGKEEATVFHRRVEDSTIKHATGICFAYIIGILIASITICSTEGLGLKPVLFEIVSAAATVGLSIGLTGSFHMLSKLIIIVLMYSGRIGGLSLLLVFAERKKEAPLKRPTEKILIG
ncbi:MAG: TrkH family potassium uptake protein [Lachnospiraceae bacterium]